MFQLKEIKEAKTLQRINLRRGHQGPWDGAAGRDGLSMEVGVYSDYTGIVFTIWKCLSVCYAEYRECRKKSDIFHISAAADCWCFGEKYYLCVCVCTCVHARVCV